MAHYAYKHACYDIDYEKFEQLVEKYKAENNGEYDGDSNYNGDNWYIMEMWIRELRAENESLTKNNEALDEYKDEIKRLVDAYGDLIVGVIARVKCSQKSKPITTYEQNN